MVVQQWMMWGNSIGQDLSDFIGLNLTAGGPSDWPLHLYYQQGAISNYDRFGHSPFYSGSLNTYSGINDTGLIQTNKIGTIPAMTGITQGGTAGSTTYGPYYLVCHDRSGGTTLPSAGLSTTTGNATLSGTNYNILTWAAKDGCYNWDILETDTAHSIAKAVVGTLTSTPAGSGIITFNDTGLSESAYTTPTRDTTADATIAGGVAVGGATGGVDATGTVNAVKFEINGVALPAPAAKGSVFATTTVAVTGPTAVGCSDTTVAVTSATTAMTVAVSPQANPNGSTFGFSWSGYVSSAGTVAVRVCNTVIDTSPPSTTYNVVVLN